MQYDFGIIGAGPAGYTAAIRASQLGKKVVLFEKEFLGGVCLNRGCIPTKTFLCSADAYKSLKKISSLGINIENYSLDFEKIVSRKEKTVEKIRKSLELLLKSYNIQIINAKAEIVGMNIIEASGIKYECENILAAVGSEPKCLKGFEFDHEFILNSDDVLNLKKIPQKVAIVGSGAIGIEWARIFSGFGVNVEIIDISSRLLPAADIDISQRLERIFKMSKIKMHLSTSVKEIKNKTLILENEEKIEPDFVLFATGRKSDYLIPVSPEIHIIGDAFGGIQLAHFASHQAVEVVEEIVLGKPMQNILVPSVVYGNPEIAWVGKTEQALSENDYKKSTFPLSALGKAQCDNDLEGFIKILSDNEGNILGAHIIAKEASALIHQLLIAMQNKIIIKDLKNCCFAHPTYSEGVYEAVLGLDNESLSLLNKKQGVNF